MGPPNLREKSVALRKSVGLLAMLRSTEEAEMLGIDGHVSEVRLIHLKFANMLQVKFLCGFQDFRSAQGIIALRQFQKHPLKIDGQGANGQERHQRYVLYRTARGF